MSDDTLTTLRAENAALQQEIAALKAERDRLSAAPKAPEEVIRKVRSFAHQIESLNGTIASMENQLNSLYGDKERLESAIGASEVDDVIQAFRRLENVISSMEHQLMTLYAGKEVLEVELGKSDPRAIVAMFRNMHQMVDGLRTELSTIGGDVDEYAAPSQYAA